MRTKDLKAAIILTVICLLLSYAASYSYVHGSFVTQGVTPLVLVVLLVLFATFILELVRMPSRVTGFLALPIHGIIWLLLIVLGARVSYKLRASRRKYVELFSHHHA